MRRFWLITATLVVLASVGAVAVDVWRDADDGSSTLCRELEVRVEGLDSFGWVNGITASAASWNQVLTDGVEHAADRSHIAERVADDRAAFERFLEALPEASRPPAQRLHALVLDPTAAQAAAESGTIAADLTHQDRRALGLPRSPPGRPRGGC